MHSQHTRRIPDATAIEGHVDNFFFDAGLVGPLAVIELKTAFTGLTLVPLIASCTDPFPADSFGLVAIATENGDSDHTVKTKSLSLRHDPFCKIKKHLKM